MSGADFVEVWTSNEISGYDLTPETDKQWIRMTNISDETKIEAGGNDSILIGAEILLSDI